MVIIPIEMPKNCRECELAFKKLWCQVGGPYNLNGEERPEGCPCIDLCPPNKAKSCEYCLEGSERNEWTDFWCKITNEICPYA